METFSYQIIRSRRKTISLQILPNGQLLVRCPTRMKKQDVQNFVESKKSWIVSHLPKAPAQLPFTAAELEVLAEEAKYRIPERVRHFAPQVGVDYGRIAIRSQHTRWGSCSAKGNLNFNCLLMLTPKEVLDYVVVHELCHRKEMNHSENFWMEVERILPNYRQSREWLKEHGGSLIARLP